MTCEPPKREDICCTCFTVTHEWVIDIIKKHNCKTLAEVQKYCPIGNRCGGCRWCIESHIKENKGN